MLRTGVLLVKCAPVPWQDVAGRLRPFVAQRVAAGDVDDVVQDVFVRIQRGLSRLRDEERFGAWLYQVARSAIAEHGRTRARHPLAATEVDEVAASFEEGDAEPDASCVLASCVSVFVARLPSPYREAVTLVELEGLPVREAAELAGASLSAMKSRVQRGRAQLRALFEQCCEIALDARGKPMDITPRLGCARSARPE